MEEKVINDIKQILLLNLPSGGHALLYGSRARGDAHDGSDLVGDTLTSDRTASGRGLSLCYGCSHGIAACIAAGSAVVAGKALAHGTLALVNLHMELPSRGDQCDSDYQSNDGDYGGGDDYRTHAYPLRNSVRRSP